MTRGADVVVVDDSAICRQRLRSIIEGDGDLRVSGEVRAGAEVLPTLDRLRPAVLVTDLVMPDMNGIEVVREVMARHPLPIIVVSGAGIAESTAFEATRSGALEVATKPARGDLRAAAALREAIRRVRDVPVVRHPGRWSLPARAAASAPLLEAEGAAPRVLGLGASAGGPAAIVDLVALLAPERAPPVVVAQHLALGQVTGFARFLAERCRLEVVICRGMTPLRPGRLVLPDDGMHLVVLGRDTAGVVRPDAGTLLVPSVDVLFTSLARSFGGAAAAAVLSGIGSDGAQGLAALRAKGALTFAQDEASSAVYGMPRAAAEAARFRLAPPDIARVVAARCGQRDSDGAPR